MSWINWFIKKCDNWKVLLNKMNNAIIHRWKNSQWMLVLTQEELSIGLGQVRLSIIEPWDKWFQPMFYDKDVWAFSEKYQKKYFEEYWKTSISITYDWEIYNCEKIREDLIKKWYTFSTNSDTEVILASYEEWWEICVNKFNWVWAFAIFDPIKNNIFCSRDRVWKKPFFYYFDWNKFIFSSEIKWILEHRELNINRKENIDRDAINIYLSTQYIPAPWTIYKDVKKLEARYNLIIHIDNLWELVLKNSCYYQIPEYKPINNKELLIQEWKKLLDDTVKDLVPRDIQVWVNLSWWLDSSLVVAKMSEFVNKENLLTFSIWFKWKYDETKYVNIVKNKFDIKNIHKYFEDKDFDMLLSNIYYFYDEPFADASIFPTTSVSILAKDYVPFVVTGNLWDEIFWWFERYRKFSIINSISRLPKFIVRFLFIITKILSWYFIKYPRIEWMLVKYKEIFRLSLCPYEQIFWKQNENDIYIPSVYKKWTQKIFSGLLNRTHWNLTQAVMVFDLFYNTSWNNYLQKTDRASMSQSLENRCPFSDLRWINWSQKCPVRWKASRFHNKILMKEICRWLVPDEIIKRRKNGFTPPIFERLDKESNIDISKHFLLFLVNNVLIDKEWEDFFVDKVFIKNRNPLYNKYFLRIFLLKIWYDKWILSD